MNNYLCRQVRKLHVKPHTDVADGFSLTERAYRYGDHGIYITGKAKRKRIFVPLTDNNRYDRQIYIKLYPVQEKLEIKVPVNVEVKRHEDYTDCTGVAMGMFTMFTTDKGHVYGERLGELQSGMTQWVREQALKHAQDKGGNTGRKKYNARKRRMTEQLHSYINMEINRFLRTEKPEVVYIVKMPRPGKHYSSDMWQRGYIKDRLKQKCREQSVRVAEVFGKGISTECSRCGAAGKKKDGRFICPACGYEAKEKENTARNIKIRGMGEETCKGKCREIYAGMG